MTDIVLLYALFNATCVIAAPLVGRLGDVVGRRHIVMLGYGVHGGINLWLVFAQSRWEVVTVMALYGLFYAIEESQSKAFIADIEPERRASAMGLYNFVTGLLYLPASLLAGALWLHAPGLAFALAAALSLAAMVALATLQPTTPMSKK